MKNAFTKEQIANANDDFRQNFAYYAIMPSQTNRVVMTQGAKASPHLMEVFSCVKNFSDFTPDNDPWGEHDFGCFSIQGAKFFFKIDYYDEHFEMGVDPYQEIPHRVLTIMLASEY